MLKSPPPLKGFDFAQEEIEEALKNRKILQIGIGTTGLCNYNCLYCFTRGGKALEGELSNDEIKRVLKDAAEMGAKTWYIAEAGEPLMHEGIAALIDYANDLGIWVVISTNGSLLTDEIAKSWLDKKVSFQVKVHSLKPGTYAKLAGITDAKFAEYDGQQMPYGLAQVLKYGYHKTTPPRAGVESVMLNQNLNELPEILRTCRKYGLFVHFEHLIMGGRAKERPEISPAEEDIESLLKELSGVDSEEFGIRPEYTPSYFGFRKVCEARLKYQLVIGSAGDAKVCFSNAPELSLGMNVREHGLKEIQKKKLAVLGGLPNGCVCMKHSAGLLSRQPKAP